MLDLRAVQYSEAGMLVVPRWNLQIACVMQHKQARIQIIQQN